MTYSGANLSQEPAGVGLGELGVGLYGFGGERPSGGSYIGENVRVPVAALINPFP